MMKKNKENYTKLIVFLSIFLFSILFCNNVEAGIKRVTETEGVELYVKQKKQLSLVIDSQPIENVRWTASSKAISISKTGVIYGYYTTKVPVTVKAISGDKEYTCTVKVKENKNVSFETETDGDRILYPANYPNGGPYKIVVFFRGLGNGGIKNNTVYNSLIERTIACGKNFENTIIIEPDRRGKSWSLGGSISQAHQSVEDLKRKIKSESDNGCRENIGIMGYSDGGPAVLLFMKDYADEIDRAMTISTGAIGNDVTKAAKEAMEVENKTRNENEIIQMKSVVNINEPGNIPTTLNVKKEFGDSCQTSVISNTSDGHSSYNGTEEFNLEWAAEVTT